MNPPYSPYSLAVLMRAGIIPLRETEILLAEILQQPRSYLYAHMEQCLTFEQYDDYCAWVERRRQGEPVAYIIGKREFWSLDLRVTPDTLIPRPETELLVEIILNTLAATPHRILDLGTGSGAMAIALAHTRPQWTIVATDSSEAALQIARKNAALYDLSNIEFMTSDWFSAIPPQNFHAIVSNPPYIAENDPHLAEGDVRFEPRGALIAGKAGLAALHTIVVTAPDYLYPGGCLFVEHGYQQAAAVRELLRARHFNAIASYRDVAGWERVTGGQKQGREQR